MSFSEACVQELTHYLRTREIRADSLDEFEAAVGDDIAAGWCEVIAREVFVASTDEAWRRHTTRGEERAGRDE